eukprot:7155547-Prorocentrum_lima.AAC.1
MKRAFIATTRDAAIAHVFARHTPPPVEHLHAAAAVHVAMLMTPSPECAAADADGKPIGGASLGEPRDACDLLPRPCASA